MCTGLFYILVLSAAEWIQINITIAIASTIDEGQSFTYKGFYCMECPEDFRWASSMSTLMHLRIGISEWK